MHTSQSKRPMAYVDSNAKMLSWPKNGRRTLATSSSFLSSVTSSLRPPGPQQRALA